jgi:predicted enzyme related to lactoylglutathione lyase
MDEPGLTHISIGAEDHGSLLDRVEALGGTVVAESDIGVAVFIRDPDGQLIELLETKGAGRA